MSLFKRLWGKVAGGGGGVEQGPPSPDLFVYVLIPEALEPMDRGERYEDPLQEALDATGLGDVSGGGSLLSAPRPDGSRIIESCGIDVDLTDLTRGLELLRSTLPGLGIPIGTQLQYTVAGESLLDELGSDGWHLARPRPVLRTGPEM
jgi:hypothetical protein